MTSERESNGRTKEVSDYYSLQSRVYSIFAPFYDVVASPLWKVRREVADAIDLLPSARVLDVATGTGAQAFAFAAKAGEVVGIDLSEAMLRIARRKNHFRNVSFRQADATALPFEAGAFDVSCVSFALHEMPGSIRERVIDEMARVTRPGGIVVVVDYGLPRARLLRSLAYHAIKLYERDHYATFVETNLPVLLERANIELSGERHALGGLAQIVVGRRSEPTARESTVTNASRAEMEEGRP